MAEMLDVYNANRQHIGVADRNVVHTCGLWHKTVHCWIVLVSANEKPKLVFQRRSRKLMDNPGSLYTTASGHVSAGETLEIAFARESEQEIGLTAKINPIHLYETPWVADFKRTDGSLFVDRVFANVYYAEYNGALSDFKFNDGEVDDLTAIDLDDFIQFSTGKLDRPLMGLEYNGTDIREVELSMADFVLNPGETIYGKYGSIADRIQANTM